MSETETTTERDAPEPTDEELRNLSRQARERAGLSGVRPIRDPFASLPAMILEGLIQRAHDAAARFGEPLEVPTNWRTTPIPAPIRERMAALVSRANVAEWEAECEKARSDARIPYSRFAQCVAGAIPKRYAEARPLPAPTDPQHEVIRDALRRRVKSREAYKATIVAARGIAEGTVRQVLFVGSSGAGKSTLAAVLLHAVAEHLAHLGGKIEVRVRARPEDLPADEFALQPRLVAESSGRPDYPMTTQRRVMPAGWKRLCEAHGFRVTATSNESPVQWATARDVFRTAASPPRPRFGEDPVDPLHVWKHAPMLVLDDIGGEPEQRNIEAVDGILWHRHDADDDVVTVATTGFFDETRVPQNMDKATEGQVLDLLAPLTARYGASLVRRIAEPGQTVVIPVLAGGR